MFENWGFLVGEIWFLIVLAALLGLFVGWLIWGGSGKAVSDGSSAELGKLRAALEDCRASGKHKDDLIGRLEARLEGRGADEAPTAASAAAAPATLAPTRSAVVDERAEEAPDFDRDGVLEGTDEGVKPMTLDAPLDGKPDNLKKIKGVGPKLEQLCNRLGF